MDCRQQDLTSFPESVEKDIKAVYLDGNGIKDLKQVRYGGSIYESKLRQSGLDMVQKVSILNEI